MEKKKQSNILEQNTKKNENSSNSISIIEANDKKNDSKNEAITKKKIKSNTKNIQNSLNDLNLKENDNNNENIINKNNLQTENKNNLKKKKKESFLKSNLQTNGLNVLSNITKNITNINVKNSKTFQNQKNFSDSNNEKKILTPVKDSQSINSLQEDLSSTLTPQVIYFYYI